MNEDILYVLVLIFSVAVQENIAVNTPVVYLQVVNQDINKKVSCIILFVNNEPVNSAQTFTVALFQVQPVDNEQNCQLFIQGNNFTKTFYNITIGVSMTNRVKRQATLDNIILVYPSYNTVQVLLTVNDVNNHAPVFIRPSYPRAAVSMSTSPFYIFAAPYNVPAGYSTGMIILI
ncbi:hypothetical protein CHS0354_018060 [Potamilus streckersoni]|uniref:Cadherin domain-containing protein n=1 Tax=Potamilus streckersoni TaxID=2493646 RepID=A0AAE0VPP5_9BIVA|nr:hypothetical protein CHS0354_018060 [Potamilus streckersoni]